MKKLYKILLIIFAFCLFTFAFILPLNPPGWYQQTLPVNDQINDIYFINSQTGWIVTNGSNITSDTSYIMKTTDGGTSWVIQNLRKEQLNAVQFLDANTGYVGGGLRNSTNVSLYKTTNGGVNWTDLNNLGGIQIIDMAFTSKDTGWITLSAPLTNVVLKTENGGMNWSQQYGQSENLGRIFMLNKDTGWFTTQSANGQLYRTTNGGNNWGLQYTFSSNLRDVFFTNKNIGWVSGGGGGTGLMRSTDGGFNWIACNNPPTIGESKLYFLDSLHGWAGCGVNKILCVKDGINWFYQYSPSFNSYTVMFVDSSTGWAGGTSLVHSSDGGGPPMGIEVINAEIPEDYKLFQNYPNPFNPITNIKYQITNNRSTVKLTVCDITGKEIIKLVDKQQSAGTYKVDFSGNFIASGVYFYVLTVEDSQGKVYTETRKMILLK